MEYEVTKCEKDFLSREVIKFFDIKRNIRIKEVLVFQFFTNVVTIAYHGVIEHVACVPIKILAESEDSYISLQKELEKWYGED